MKLWNIVKITKMGHRDKFAHKLSKCHWKSAGLPQTFNLFKKKKKSAKWNKNKASQVALVVKNPPANAGDIRDTGLIPGSGRSPTGENGNSLQCSCLENPMDRGAWRAVIHEVTKSQIQLKQFSTTQQHACMISVSQHPFQYLLLSILKAS